MPRTGRVFPVLLAWLCVLVGVVCGARTARAQGVRGDASTSAESSLSIQIGPAVALSPELLGRPVTRLEVVTAGGRWQAAEQLRRTPLGRPLSAAYARAVLQEILSTGRYAEASATAQAYGSGALLRVTVLPRRIVTELRVSGGGLDTALVLEAAAVSPGDDITVQTLSALEQKVRELYRAHGYPAAAVTLEAIDTDEPLHVVLNIAIQPGDALSVAERQFELHPRRTDELARLAEQYAVEAGDRLDEPQLQHADLELAARLRDEGYHDAGVEHRTQWSSGANGFVLVVAVWAGPKTRMRFDGNVSIDTDELARELDLPEDADHTPAALSERLRDFYVKRGFLDVQVNFERRDADDGSLVEFWFHIRENPRVVVQARHFPCITGQRSAADLGAEIDSFSSEALPGSGLVGPVDSNQLDAQIAPHNGSPRVTPLALDPWTTYDPAVYEQALEHLQALYRSEGYLSARVGPVLVARRACAANSPAQHCWPVGDRQLPPVKCAREPSLEPEPPPNPALSCVPDPKRALRCEPNIELSIPIVLGPRAELWDVGFEGNRTLVESDLHQASGLVPGQPLSQLALEEARRRIVERYAEEGYAFAGVEADIELSPDRTRAKAKFTISEREPVVLRDIVVRGAQFTNTNLILSRSALERGKLYRRSLVRATEERLATLGVFTSVTVDLEDPEVPARQKVAVIRVQERLPQYLDVRPGFSTGEGLRIAFEYGHRNIAGRAIQFALRIQLGYLPPALILEPSVRRQFEDVLDEESLLYLLERRNTATVEFPDIGLGPLYRLSVEGLDSRDITGEFAIEKHAAFATLSYRPERAISFSFGAGIEFNEADLFAVQSLKDYLLDHANDTNLIRLLNIPDGLTFAISQRLGFTWDRRDNSVAATRGTLVSLNLEHVNAFPLETTRAGGAAVATSPYKGHFVQYSGRLGGYLRFTERGLALATSLRFGFNQQLVRGSTTYPDRLFFLGGIDSLRGFPLWSVMPQDLYELQQRDREAMIETRSLPISGGDLMINPRAELRIPVLGIWQTAVFVDTGNLWARANQVFESFQLRYSAGAGLRVSTPVGPLALDYGVNLDRRPNEGFGAFHFSIGLF